MATVTTDTGIQQVGEIAGQVWQVLDEQGPTSLAKLTKKVKAPRDLVLLAVGWLAREDKITLQERGRVRMVSLST